MKPAAAVTLTITLLTACGFHLRGDINLDHARVHITGSDLELRDALTDALTQRGATVTDRAKNATVIALQSRFNRATLTTDARGRANAHEIRYTVEFRIKRPGDGDGDGDGDNESRLRTVTLTRALEYDSSRQLQSEAESTFLESAMRREAAAQIMQYLTRD